MQHFRNGLVLLVATVSLTQPAAQAATLPDAGVLRQQIEQHNEPTAPLPSAPEQAAQPPRAPTGESFVVKGFKFSGNRRITSDRLQQALMPYLNRPLDFNQLQEAAAAVGTVYRDAGWIVRAYLPQQEIEEGIVTIEIVEAVFGTTHFEGAPTHRLSRDTLQQYVDAAQKSGEPINALAVDRTLLLLSDVPGVAVTGSLHEGDAAGQTNLLLNAKDRPLLSGDAALDNTGSRSTGKQRFAGNFSLNSPLGQGDQLSSNLMLTDGSSYGRMAFNLPVGYDGWRIGASGSAMTYRLVAPEFKALAANGASSSYGLDANYPLLRTRLENLYLAINYDHKYFNNAANQNTTTRYVTDNFSAGINGNLIDNQWGGGINNFGLTWVHGTVNLNGSPNQAADAAGSQTAGAFNKLRYSASRSQTLSENLTAYAALTGQLSNRNLDSSERFYLGGANGVRAYPASEGGGSEGQLVNLELRAQLPDNLGLTGFFDWGHVTVNRNNQFAGAPLLNNYSLKGIGMALQWQSELGPMFKATWSRRLGTNPNPTASGTDQDGTLLKNRFWLQISMAL